MNALEKLQAVQISADNRISEADRRFCKAHQSAYKEAKDMLSELKYIWEDALNRQHQLLEPADTPWTNIFRFQISRCGISNSG